MPDAPRVTCPQCGTKFGTAKGFDPCPASLADCHRCIVSKRLGSPYRSGRSPHWVKIKNPNAPAVKREAEEDCRDSRQFELAIFRGFSGRTALSPFFQFGFPSCCSAPLDCSSLNSLSASAPVTSSTSTPVLLICSIECLTPLRVDMEASW